MKNNTWLHPLKKYGFYCAIAALIAVLSSCERTQNRLISNEAVVTHYAAMAHAAYQDSLDTAIHLQQTIETFLAAPTEETLRQAKAAYKNARIPYQQSEVMRWDSAITLDKALDNDGGPSSVDDWEAGVNAWPLDERHIDR